ncbi:MAG: ExbD/TolR family protein [Parerythrobacter sp.]
MAMGVATVGGGRRTRGARRAPMAEINVTPFVDVMLVLLIIFMVTAPLLTTGVPVDLPDSRADALPEETEPVTLSIANDGVIYIDEEPLGAGALPAALAAIGPGSDGQRPAVTLRADRTLDYGRVMGVMGELNRAGFTRIALVTQAAASAPVAVADAPDVAIAGSDDEE